MSYLLEIQFTNVPFSMNSIVKGSSWPNEYSVRQLSGKSGFHPRSSHTKDSKMTLDSALLNTQHYKVQINGKVE